MIGVDTVRARVQRVMRQAKDELAELVAFKSVADAKHPRSIRARSRTWQ